MEDQKYIRKVQCSVTNFLYYGDDYLLLHRSPNKRIDANLFNGIGGRVEPVENYLDAAIRETEEETGFNVSPENISLAGIVKLEGGYSEDWVMCFFKIKVPSKIIPLGNETEDGKLIWINKEKVLNSNYELVDDLNYCFKDIVAGDSIFFFTGKVNNDQKIYDANTTKLSIK